MGLVELAPFILGLFGEGFVRPRGVHTVLAVRPLVNVGDGSVGYFMNMTGNEDRMAQVLGVAAVVNIALKAVAIPFYGALVAAVATARSMAGWHIWPNGSWLHSFPSVRRIRCAQPREW